MRDISPLTRLLLLVGHPVARSISPQIYNRAFREEDLDAVYLSLDIPPDGFARVFPSLIESGLAGNITAPYKERALPFIDIPSEAALLAGACNVFWVQGGMSHGDNTDIGGFLDGLSPGSRRALAGGSALLLGAGGAARAIALALLTEGLKRLLIANRSPVRRDDLSGFLGGLFPDREILSCGHETIAEACEGEYPLLINATSAGWEEGYLPLIDPSAIPGLRHFFDVIYRGETPLMRACASRGVEVMGGLEMLIRQGARSLACWFDMEPPVERMREAARLALGGEGGR